MLGTNLKRVARLLRGNKEARHSLGMSLSRAVNSRHFYGECGTTWLNEAEPTLPPFLSNYERQRRADRLFVLQGLAKTNRDQPCVAVEMGVYHGASAFVMLGSNESLNYLGFDSFEGLPQPSEILDGKHWRRGDLKADLATTEANLANFMGRFKLVKGWIPDCLDGLNGPDLISIGHIDVDLYDPTLFSLRYCAERSGPETMIVCDDYGFSSCPGATKAVDDFLAASPLWSKLHLPTGQALMWRRG